jgi:hypothetical protein
MSSLIEQAARKLSASASMGMYTEEQVLNILKSVQECDADPNGKKASIRAAAKQQYGEQGSIEIDSDAVVSISEDGGAYVQAWVWVQ